MSNGSAATESILGHAETNAMNASDIFANSGKMRAGCLDISRYYTDCASCAKIATVR